MPPTNLSHTLLDAILATKPPFSPADTAKEHAEFLKCYGIYGVRGDAYAGEFPRELFAKNGIAYEVSEKNKSELYLELIPMLTSRKVELVDDEKLKTELRRLERRRGRNGKDSIDHPPRGSDDIANAVAGVVWLASNGGASLDDFIEMNRLAPGTTTRSDRAWLDQGVDDNLHPVDSILDRSRSGRTFWDL